MGKRSCARCGAEVEEVDGYCRLGHDVRLRPPVQSLSDLRTEVERSFADDAGGDAPRPATGSGAPSPPTRIRTEHRFVALWAEAARGPEFDNDPIAAFAPYPRMRWGPARLGRLRSFVWSRRSRSGPA